MNTEDYDPRGLIREAYRIDGITEVECRSIFFDWALSRPDSPEEARQIRALFDIHAVDAPDHPMSQVLREGLTGIAAPRGRRGGAGGRR